jgi:hypothetical protein
MFALTEIQRNYDDDGCLNLDLTFQPSDWFNHRATNCSLDIKGILNSSERHLTLREKYLNSVNFSDSDLQPIKYFSHTFSVAMCLLTGDNKFIIVQRAANVINPNQYSVAVNETLDRNKDTGPDGRPDLWHAVKRGTIEEMGFEPEEKEIEFFSLGTDYDSCSWGMQGLITTDKTLAEIINIRRQLPKTKREDKALIPIDFSLAAVANFVVSNGPWNGGAPVCIYNVLVHKFKKERVDKFLKKMSI